MLKHTELIFKGTRKAKKNDGTVMTICWNVKENVMSIFLFKCLD